MSMSAMFDLNFVRQTLTYIRIETKVNIHFLPGKIISVSASAVTCDDGFALPASDSIKSFKLWCGNDGAYSCEEAGHDIECPVCESKH